MEEEQYEAIIVNPDLGEEIPPANGPNILELGKKLLIAAKEGNTETVRNLMKGGAPFATDWLGTTSLHAAALNGHLETCELLLRSGILKDARTKVEKTPLHMACQEGHSEVVLLLLANGADVNACDMLNMTPLHWAVEKEKPETVRILLQNGADPTMVNKFDKTCFDIANDSERHDIIELLQNEPRRGEYTVIEKPKAEMRLTPQIRKVAQPSVKPYELVNVSATKNLDRPKTAIVLPTFQNKKIGAMSKKPVRSVHVNANEEQQSRLSALQLLEEHGIEMLEEDEDINIVASAVGSGQTVVLTEAGKQALSLTDAKNINRIKSVKRQQNDRSPSSAAKFIRIDSTNNSLNNAVSNAIKGGTAKKIVRINTTPKKMEVTKTLQDINKKLEEARKEAEQYKQLYARKQREAEELRSTLENIARTSELGMTVTAQDADDEEMDEEEFDEEEENEEDEIE